MTPERQLVASKAVAYGLMYFMLLDAWVCVVTSPTDDLSFLNLDLSDPGPATYNTLALIAAFIATSAAVWNVGRLRNKIEGK